MGYEPAFAPGELVCHRKFGLGLVRLSEHDEDVANEAGDPAGERVLVRFQASGDKWLAVAVAPLWRVTAAQAQRVPALQAWLAAQLAPPAPSPPPVDGSTLRRRRRLQAVPGEMPCGPPYRAVLPALPGHLPWAATSGLVGPFDAAWEAVGWYYSRRLRAPRRRMAGRVAGQPLFVCSAVPPFGALRNVLGNMAYDLAYLCQYAGFEQALRSHWWANEGDTMVFQLAEPLDEGADTQGAVMQLNHTAERARLCIQRLRERALANGRWWPAPLQLVLLLHPDGSATARMRFAAGYQPADQPWLESTCPAPLEPLPGAGRSA